MTKRGLLSLLLIAGIFSGCKEELMHGLPENDANKLLSRLYNASVEADKRKDSDGTWSIVVESSDLHAALRYLDSTRALPSIPESIPDGSGMVPSREDQVFRYERQLSTAIQRTLESISGVRESRVHLNLPPKDPLLGIEKTGQGSASALLVVDRDVTISPEEVKGLIGGAAGIPQDRVAVLIKRADPVPQQNQIKPVIPASTASTVTQWSVMQIAQYSLGVVIFLAVMTLWFWRRRVQGKRPFRNSPFVALATAGRE